MAKVARLLGELDEQSKSKAKRVMISQFRQYIEAQAPKRVSYTPADVTAFRADITVSDDLKAKIRKAEAQSPFEADATVLARYYAAHFADFIEAIAE